MSKANFVRVVLDSLLLCFSLDDSSANDLKASLNEVARVTGKKGSIIYVGHSRGSTIAFMFASQFPNDTKELLQGIVALSPIVYLELPSQWKLLLPAAPLIGVIFKSQFFSYQRSDFQKTLKHLGITSIFYHDKIIHLFLKHFCSLVPYICKYSSSMTFGQSNNFLPVSRLSCNSSLQCCASCRTTYSRLAAIFQDPFQWQKWHNTCKYTIREISKSLITEKRLIWESISKKNLRCMIWVKLMFQLFCCMVNTTLYLVQRCEKNVVLVALVVFRCVSEGW